MIIILEMSIERRDLRIKLKFMNYYISNSNEYNIRNFVHLYKFKYH